MIHKSYLQPLLLPLWWLVGVLGYFIYKINAFRTKTQVSPPFTNAVLQSEDLSIEVFKPFYLKDFETIIQKINLLINGYLGFLLPSPLSYFHHTDLLSCDTILKLTLFQMILVVDLNWERQSCETEVLISN